MFSVFAIAEFGSLGLRGFGPCDFVVNQSPNLMDLDFGLKKTSWKA